jgi:hypothetical protein
MNSGYRTRFLLLGACGLCLLVALLFGIVIWPRPQVSALDIRFAGFTQGSSQFRSAVFRVTNLSRNGVVFVPLEPQVRIGASWSGVVPPDPASTIFALEGLQSTDITLAISNWAQVWRLPVLWSRSRFNSQAEFYARREKVSVNDNVQFLAARVLTGAALLFFADEPEIAHSPQAKRRRKHLNEETKRMHFVT